MTSAESIGTPGQPGANGFSTLSASGKRSYAVEHGDANPFGAFDTRTKSIPNKSTSYAASYISGRNRSRHTQNRTASSFKGGATTNNTSNFSSLSKSKHYYQRYIETDNRKRI